MHRIGRTARAGRDGTAISFCDDSERAYLQDIQREIRRKLDVMGEVRITRAARAAAPQNARPKPPAKGARGRRRERRRRRTYS